MLGSDKTHLNNTFGDKHVHGVYMSCGNIKSTLRTKQNARCWAMLAQIPVVQFDQKDLQGVLTQRLYHICMDIVTKSLKACSQTAVRMTDADGIVRFVRTVLLAHIADYPEQQLIACVSGSSSPVTLARYDSFGFGTRRPPRTGELIKQRIAKLLKSPGLRKTDLRKYKYLARLKGLNAVYEPYWRDWSFADPSVFLVPDALHQWHRFFYDHIMDWAKRLMGKSELDARYSLLQKHVGYHQFVNGFTRRSQHTCREFREMQRYFIAVIANHGSMTSPIMKAFRALLEFIYIAQLPIQSDTSLAALKACIRTFHKHKAALSATGVRNGPRKKGKFHIKKLELMLSVFPSIKNVGSSQQYSAEQTERLHITEAKVPYRMTNKKEYKNQICRFLDRREKLNLLALHLRRQEQARRGTAASMSKNEHSAHSSTSDVGATTMSNSSSADTITFAQSFLPKPVRNYFEDDKTYVPRNSTTAFLLTDRITHGNMKASEVANLYKLPNYRRLFREFFDQGGLLVDCWDCVRLQMRSVLEPGTVLEPKVVMAARPSPAYPGGFCNFVLVQNKGRSGLKCIKGA